MLRSHAALLSALLVLTAAAPLRAAEVPPADAEGEVPVSQGGESRPYLAPGATPDMSAVLPAPPALGSPAQAADTAVFRATRALANTPRWRLATADAEAKPKALLGDFGCALGTTLDSRRLPALDHLLYRVLGDVEVAFRTAKADVKRLRPLVGNDLPICVPRTERLTGTYSYPSGHATRGWLFALILAELAPDRATAILTRGRVYGESRVVCGAHWLSDIEAGRTVASALVATLQGDTTFRADLERARIELTAARAAPTPPDAGECKVEAEAAATALR